MEKEKLNHRNPIVLAKDRGYHVISGVINLFLVRQSDESDSTCKRNFLVSIAEGTTILGTEAIMEHGDYKVVAVGSGNAQIQSFPISQMEITKEGLVKWLAYITDHGDQSQFKDMLEEEQCKLITLAEELTLLYIKAKADEIQLRKILQKGRYIEKERSEEALLNQAVNMLTDHKMETIYQQPGSISFKICQVVANALNLEIASYKHFTENQQQPRNMIKIYLEKMNIKYRAIRLKRLWWKEVDGTLIAFKTNEQPVAILPVGTGCYEMIDLELGLCVPVDAQSAGELLKDAFMLYRTLPEEEISGRQLLSFGLKRITKKDFILFVASFIGIGLLGMTTPLLTGFAVDWIIPQGDLALLFQMGIMLIVFTLTTFFFYLARSFIILRLEGQLDVDLQIAIWDRLLNLPLGFFKQFTSAELASRALGITMIRDIVSGPILEILMTGIYSLFCWLVLFYYNVHLAAIASVMVVGCIIVNYFLTRKELFFEYRINQLTNILAGLSFQLIKGAIKIQQSGAIERAYYKWAKEQSEKHKAMQGKGLVICKMEAFNGMYLPFSIGVIYYLIISNPNFSLPVGHFIGFYAAYMMFISAILNIFGSMHILCTVIPLYDRGKIILQTKPECKENKITLNELIGKISVDRLHFQYSEQSPEILKDVSLEIKAGEYVGIVGTSGSGKSTLMRLLLGFETINKGKITFDDQDINSLDLRELRKKIGVVLQSGKLMTDSIYHNIVGTHLHLTIEDAWSAAKVAGIDEDIKAMPMGMHTYVMEGAGTISGGQKQRILIARAVVNKPKILFFDEATSALDNITQANIKRSLDQFSATRIVIAHRLSTVKNCNRIIVLDCGEIKEVGSYEELIQKKGVFYKIAERQLA